MRKRLLTATVGLGLVAALSVVLPATAEAQGFVGTCTRKGPEWPHISSDNLRNRGTIDVKSSTQLECTSAEPVEVQAVMTLEKRTFFDLIWLPTGIGNPVTKTVVPGATQIWRRGELFALKSPCVPGTYRARLTLFALSPEGPVSIIGNGALSEERVIDCKPRKVSMVIDDTGSMGGVIGSVSASLSSFIQSTPEDEYTRWSLTTFKDSPTTVGTTEDRDQALSLVNGLRASGGGDCPEDALGGISSGLSTLGTDEDTEKQMVVATDASAHGGDVNGIIAAAQAAGVKVNVLLTGDCGFASAAAASTDMTTTDFPYEVSSQVVLRRIAEETGGQYFFIPGGTTADFTAALDAIFASIANPDPGDDTQPPTVSLSVSPSEIWPPNHQMVQVTPTVTATDNADPNPTVALVGVEVSQPDDGQGDGHTADDVQITADGQVFVRAERSATDGPRVYTITYRATDQAGNVGFGSATVTVPRDASGG
jgi:von Willebrand factor type A domain